ncbi:MAG: hypothetical protein FJZ56_04280 [Chlamydiae bacterium]|nr:hypothetical protein [Chlamydiota bacterium]
MNQRPIECTNCQKKASIIYKEIQQGKVETFQMCRDCPCLMQKLSKKEDDTQKSSLKCPLCKTSYDQNVNLGCPECYTAFQDSVTKRLKEEGAIPMVFDPSCIQMDPILLHVGRAPLDVENTTPIPKKLENLHIALTEALASENYEQAALLRDKIKTLMERNHGAA